jgi:hypothetical protein
LDTASGFQIELWIEGNRVFAVGLKGQLEILENGIWFVDLLSKARCLARHYDLSPELPTLTMSHANEIEILYSLVTFGEVTTRVENLTLSCSIVPDKNFLDSTIVKNKDEPFQIAIEYESSPPLPFLGTSVEIGHQILVATSVLLGDQESIVADLKAGGIGKARKVTFIGTSDCKLVRKTRPVALVAQD